MCTVDGTEAASEGDEMRSEEEIARVRAPAAIMRSAHVVAAPVTIVREEAEAETAGVLQPVVLVVVVTTIARAVAVRAHVWIEMKSRVTRASEKAQRETHQNAVVARVPVATRTEAVEMTGAIAERALLQEMTVLVMITALTEAQVVKKRDAAVQSDSHAEDAMMAMMMEIDVTSDDRRSLTTMRTDAMRTHQRTTSPVSARSQRTATNTGSSVATGLYVIPCVIYASCVSTRSSVC